MNTWNLTCSQAKDIVSSKLQILRDISTGKHQCDRHDRWLRGSSKTRSTLQLQSHQVDCLSEPVRNCIIQFLLEEMREVAGGPRGTEWFAYIWDVSFPEAAIILLMACDKMPYENALEAMFKFPEQEAVNVSSSSDSEDEGTDARGVIESLERGKNVQTWLRRKTGAGCRSGQTSMVDICEMRATRLGTYRRHGAYVGVCVEDSHTYSEVAEVAAGVHSLELSDVGFSLRLFRCNGSMISPNTKFVGDRPWTWRMYRSTLSKYTSQMKFGVGVVMDNDLIDEEEPPSAKRKKLSSKLPDNSTLFDTTSMKVLYCGELAGQGLDTEHLLTRMEVYNTCIQFTENSTTNMDSLIPFIPENRQYRVAEVYLGSKCLLSVDGSGKFTVNGDDESDHLRIVHQSPPKVLLPVNATVPLYCIASNHSLEDNYEWRRGLDEELVNTPVLWAKLPGAYHCAVTRNSGQVCKSSTIMVEWEKPDLNMTPQSTSIAQSQSSSTSLSHKVSCGPAECSYVDGSVMVYTHSELAQACRAFCPEALIGKGGFGSVFKGVLRRCQVAVKVLTDRGVRMLRAQSNIQMKNEVAALSRFRHPNILSLMGYCAGPPCLVFPLMPRYSLFSNLHEFKAIKIQQALTWLQRISVLRDASCGLCYLHSETPPVVHHDVNSSNILLDDKLNARISDFGFTIQMPQHVHGTTLITATEGVPGTLGYRPPEFSDLKYSTKSDVYSLCVVILETYTGLLAFSDERDASNLVDYVEDDCASLETFKMIGDLKAHECPAQLMKVLFDCVKVGVARVPKKRPLMSQVYDDLNEVYASATTIVLS